MCSNEKCQRREPAADDVRFVSERIGSLPFAAPCGWPSSISGKIGRLLCGKGQHGAGYQTEESEFRFHAVATVCRQMSRLPWILSSSRKNHSGSSNLAYIVLRQGTITGFGH